MTKKQQELVVFQTENGSLQLRKDVDEETVWASVKQIASIFDIDRSVVSRHIANILKDGELNKNRVCAKFAHTTQHGALSDKTQTRSLDYYNLDIILSVGYRTKSAKAIRFRQWANKILKQHISKGYTINSRIIERNKTQFLETLEDLKLLSSHTTLEAKDVLSLIQSFSDTWFNLEQFDKGDFPKITNQTLIEYNAKELESDLQKLKKQLIVRGEATSLFAQEKREGAFKGIFNTIFQTVFGVDAYDSIEEKAAHLLYFVVKNHPFNDGNKRSGAFSFIWFMHKSKLAFADKISPETLTTLTILIAQSPPGDKDKMIGMILLLLNKQ